MDSEEIVLLKLQGAYIETDVPSIVENRLEWIPETLIANGIVRERVHGIRREFEFVQKAVFTVAPYQSKKSKIPYERVTLTYNMHDTVGRLSEIPAMLRSGVKLQRQKFLKRQENPNHRQRQLGW